MRRSSDQRLSGIYAIVDSAASPDTGRAVADVLAAGVRLVQVRVKGGADRTLLREVRRLTRAAGALFVVNDDLDALDDADADGVHLGQEDLARCGPGVRARVAGRLLGISAGNLAELAIALGVSPDYVGTGPYRVTASKRDAGAPIGLAGLRAVVAAAPVPVAAIGGIERADIPAIAASGAAMAAVIGAIARGPDRTANARALAQAWDAVAP